MQSLHVALIQVRWTGHPDTMKEQYREMVAQAVQEGAELICLPEFSLLPYFPGTRDKDGFAWAEPLQGGMSETFFSELARQHQVQVVGSLYEKTPEGVYYDTATIHLPTGELGFYTRKVHIPSGDGYYETDFFIGYDQYPVHDLGKVKVAAPTCYDQWFPELARIYALNGAELIIYPTAIGGEPTAPDFDSKDAWQTVMRGHAVANGVFVIAVNRVGTERLTFYGSSFVCDPLGRIIAEGGRDTVEVIHAHLDAGLQEQYRQLFPLLHQRKPQTYQRLLGQYDQAPAPDWLEEK